MGSFRGLSFQDWLLTIVSAVTIAFIAHVWISQEPSPTISMASTTSRQVRETDQWAVTFALRNRGDAPAERLRLRLLAGNANAPERLQAADDFQLANELDPAGEVVRVFLTPRPPQPAAEEAKPAPAPAAAPAAGRGAQAAPPPAPTPPAAAREPQSYVVVVQADYPAGLFGSTVSKRWYYFYHEGDAAAVQVGEMLRQRVASAADKLLP